MVLSKKFVQEMKGALVEEEKNLKEELLSFAKPSLKNENDFETVFPNFGDSVEDNTTEVEVYQTNLAVEHTLEKALRDVVQALKRLESGEYGKCKYCGKVMSVDRLKARPTSGSCVECKTKLKGR